jgi:hypothetical protein
VILAQASDIMADAVASDGNRNAPAVAQQAPVAAPGRQDRRALAQQYPENLPQVVGQHLRAVDRGTARLSAVGTVSPALRYFASSRTRSERCLISCDSVPRCCSSPRPCAIAAMVASQRARSPYSSRGGSRRPDACARQFHQWRARQALDQQLCVSDRRLVDRAARIDRQAAEFGVGSASSASRAPRAVSRSCMHSIDCRLAVCSRWRSVRRLKKCQNWRRRAISCSS